MITQQIHQKLNDAGVAREMFMWSVDEFLEKTVSSLNPKIDTALEIGTCNGISTLVLASYAKRVYTFDATYRNAEYIWSFFPELRKKIIAFSGAQDVLDFTILDLSQWYERWGIDFNFAFIDGEHTYDGAKHDFELAKQLNCKRYLFHDVHGDIPQHSGVGKFAVIELGAKVLDERFIYGYWEDNGHDKK